MSNNIRYKLPSAEAATVFALIMSAIGFKVAVDPVRVDEVLMDEEADIELHRSMGRHLIHEDAESVSLRTARFQYLKANAMASSL
jgi:hypothetical protein